MTHTKFLKLLIAVGGLVGIATVTGCSGTKDAQTSSLDMAEYRKMMEEQKKQQEHLAEATSSTPEMTVEEHERRGDLDAQNRNYPLASLH